MEKRTEIIKFRVTESEKKFIQEKADKLGYGSMTAFLKSSAEDFFVIEIDLSHYREVAKEIPLEYLLIETDSPYMAPEPHRGKRNDPSLVQFVADKIAQEKGISYEKVCEVTKENAKRFFNIK